MIPAIAVLAAIGEALDVIKYYLAVLVMLAAAAGLVSLWCALRKPPLPQRVRSERDPVHLTGYERAALAAIEAGELKRQNEQGSGQ
jgi:hypothetical protein